LLCMAVFMIGILAGNTQDFEKNPCLLTKI